MQPAQVLLTLRRMNHDPMPPYRTLLEVLRDDLHLTGTKEGCRSGDCGACTVVFEEPNRPAGSRWRATNSCIALAHAAHGLRVWTVEDLATNLPDGTQRLHPVQQALVDHHASQCGFCTPGFVMSLFALYRNRLDEATEAGQAPRLVSRDEALEALSGNLCRCTGYRPILDAAQAMLTPAYLKPEHESQYKKATKSVFMLKTASPQHQAPVALAELLQCRAEKPTAQLVAGCTDVGLWITKGFQQPNEVLDLTRVTELQNVSESDGLLAIGAAVRLTDAFAALVARWPELAGWASRFAGLPVRNAGTLGGNVANGSPIGDSMPILMALGAQVRLMHWDHTCQATSSRELPLEQLYTGYRQKVMRPTEVLTHVLVPLPSATDRGTRLLRAYKISKRYEDDISAVCLGLNLRIEQGQVRSARIGVGGVAATPVRAQQTEAALQGQPWTQATAVHAAQVLHQEFSPISDMRASATYRRDALAALLQRAWLESQSPGPLNLEHTDRRSLDAWAANTTGGAAA